jgi:hypothetical protein
MLLVLVAMPMPPSLMDTLNNNHINRISLKCKLNVIIGSRQALNSDSMGRPTLGTMVQMRMVGTPRAILISIIRITITIKAEIIMEMKTNINISSKTINMIQAAKTPMT